MAPTHFSLRKFRRKLGKDGYRSAIVDSIETVYRRLLYNYIFEYLLKTERINILEKEDLMNERNSAATLEMMNGHHVHVVDSAKIFSQTGLIINDYEEVISQNVGSPQFSKQFTLESLAHQDFGKKTVTPHIFLSRIKKVPTTKIEGVVCPLIPRYRNYYHWVVGTLPKIRFAKKYEQLTNDSVTFLLPPSPPQWIEETIALLGYSNEKFLIAQDPIYEPSQVLVPPHPFPGKFEDHMWIRKKVFDNSTLRGKVNSNKRVYISREKAVGRRVVNEQKLLQVLSDFGFKKYRLEDRQFKENVRLFSNAEVIVSPHGAGLTDILFANDCKVIELFGSRKDNAYELICQSLGLDYVPVKCDAVSTDILADIDCIEKILDHK